MFFLYSIIEAIYDTQLLIEAMKRRSALTVEYFSLEDLDNDFAA